MYLLLLKLWGMCSCPFTHGWLIQVSGGWNCNIAAQQHGLEVDGLVGAWALCASFRKIIITHSDTVYRAQDQVYLNMAYRYLAFDVRSRGRRKEER